MEKKKRKAFYIGLVALLFLITLYFFSGIIMTSMGRFLVVDEDPQQSDSVVVLNTGIDWYPRLMEAATLYKKGFVKKVVINGNRKSEALRNLEKMGFQRCCPWYEEGLRMLEVLGVPREGVMAVSAENAYDTISEAKIVGKALREAGMSSLIITTSKYHTRRARHIWNNIFPDQFIIHSVAAYADPFAPEGWWKDGRQIRSVLAEYGAWFYYFWKKRGKLTG